MFHTAASGVPPYDSILVGRRPHRMVEALEHIFDLSLQNPIITYLTGDPGSGKSQLLYYMRRKFITDKSRIMVVIHADKFDSRAKNPLGQLALLKEICKDEQLKERGLQAGFELDSSVDEVDEAALAERINQTVRAVEICENANRKQLRNSFGLVVAIDGLDEYVRPSGGKGLLEQDTRALMFSIRFLLDSLLKTCIVLAFTTDIFGMVQDVTKGDVTFQRRLIPSQEFDGSDLSFQAFNLEETREMYLGYRGVWLSKATAAGLDIAVVKNRTEWPISPSAIELVLEATTGRPGALQEVFQSSFEAIQDQDQEWLRTGINVDLKFMANVIYSISRTAPYGLDMDKGDVRRRIDFLRGWAEQTSTPSSYPTEPQVVDVIKAILELADFKVTGSTVDKLSSTHLYVLNVEANFKMGNIGVLVMPDTFITKGDIEILNDFVTDNKVHQLVLFTQKEGFEWIYSPSPFPSDHEGTRKRNLSNYSYVLRFSKEQFSGLGVTAMRLTTESKSAALWCADRLCSPIEGYKLSEVLSSMAMSAIRGANV